MLTRSSQQNGWRSIGEILAEDPIFGPLLRAARECPGAGGVQRTLWPEVEVEEKHRRQRGAARRLSATRRMSPSTPLRTERLVAASA